MKNVHAMLVLMVVLLPMQGQANTKVDSLKQLLQSEVPIDRAEVLWSIAYELFDVDNEQAVFYAERAYHDVWQGGDSLQIVKVGTTYSQLLRRVEKLRMSIELAEKVLPIARRHDFRKYTVMLLNSLTLGMTFTEEFGKALEFGFESLELRRIDGKKSDIATALNNLGLLYSKLTDADNAIKCYRESVKLRHEINDTTSMRTTFCNLALTYNWMGQPNTALEYLDSAMQFNANSSRLGLMEITHGLGEAYDMLNKSDLSAKCFLRSLELARSLKDKRYQLIVLNALADLELKRGNLLLCRRYLTTLDATDDGTEHKQIRIQITKTKAEYYAAVGDMGKAYSEAKKYISEAASQVLEMNREIRKVQQLEIEKENIRKLEMQASILDLQNLTLAKQRIFAGSVTFLLFILAFLTYRLLKANSQIRSVNRLLDERVVERTGELRKHSNLVQHLVDEHKISGNRFASELFSLVGTLKGLLNLCEAESSTNSQLCLSKASVVVEKIEGIVARLKSPPVQ